jgi:hypothetical protein
MLTKYMGRWAKQENLTQKSRVAVFFSWDAAFF